jgi:hypothetical protein
MKIEVQRRGIVNTESKTNSNVRVTVSLSVHSEALTAEKISDRLGMQPDSSRKKGDLNRAGKPFSENTWTIKSERHLPETADDLEAGISDCLRDVLSRIERAGGSFRELASQEHASLLIGILAGSVPPLIIEGDILQRMASLHLDHFEIDLII